MCCGCWIDEGSPQIDNQLVRDGHRAIEALYELNPVGGYLHIVTDDNNLDEDNLIFCQDAIDKNEDGESGHNLDLHRKVIGLLKQMTYEERVSCLGLFDGCWE